MPLLQVVGITSFWTTFFGCFVFLTEEKQDDYDWVLRTIKEKIFNEKSQPVTIVTDREQALMNAIPGVFPTSNNVLSMWHIEKNLIANCKSQFNGDEDARNEFLVSWRSVVRCYEVDDLETGWEGFKKRYRSSHSAAISYIQSTWMIHKERFATPWTRRFFHLGLTTASRVESAYHTLKSYINVSTDYLFDVQGKICLAVANQEKDYQAKLMNERIRIAHTHRIHLFSRVTGKISAYALTLTL